MEKSLQWYTLGAKKGSNQCLNKMGLIIETGFDSYTPDPLRAAELYQKAYENHNSDGAYNLGLLYLNSEEFDATEEEAVQLIHQAAMQGNQKAQKYLLSLGYIDNSAEFIPQDSFIYPSYSEDIYEEEESEDEDDIVQYINFDHQSLDEEAVSEVQVQNNRTPTPNFPLMEKSQAGKIYQMTGQIMKNKDAIRPQPKGVSKVKFKAEKENSDMIQNPNATQKDVTSKTSPKKAPKTAPKTAPKAAPKIAPKATLKIVPKATPKPKISNAMTGAIVRNKPKGPEEKKGKIVKQKHKTFFI